MAKTKNLGDAIRKELAEDPGLAREVEKQAFYADIARKVYQHRRNAQLSQKQLAAKVGTKQSVISRVEGADYQGHSLSMLRKVADALGLSIRLDFCAKVVHTPTDKRFLETTVKVQRPSK